MNSYNGFTPAQRMKALGWLKGEYAAGRRSRPLVCDACGQDKGIIEHHSEDYSAPYGDHIGEYALCYRCHMMVHCRFKAQTAWQYYKEAVASGITFLPIYTRDWILFKQQTLEGKPPVAIRGTERTCVLSRLEKQSQKITSQQ